MSEKQREYGDLLLTLIGERLVVLIEKDVLFLVFLFIYDCTMLQVEFPL